LVPLARHQLLVAWKSFPQLRCSCFLLKTIWHILMDLCKCLLLVCWNWQAWCSVTSLVIIFSYTSLLHLLMLANA